MKRADFIVYLTIGIAVCLLLFAAPNNHKGTVVSVVTPDQTYQYLLNDDRTVTIPSKGYTLTVCIQNGQVSVTEADCPDLVCLHTMPISENQSMILCVPAQVKICILEEGGTLDGILY